MAIIDWPTAPTVGQVYSFNGITYVWTGTKWQTGTAPVSLTGPTGPAGGAGTTGPTGPTGGVVLLTSGSVSAAATLDIPLTAYTAYRDIIFVLTNWQPVSDDVNLSMRFSTDGGATYLTATNYSQDYLQIGGNSITGTNSSGGSTISISSGVGNLANFYCSGIVELVARAAAQWTKAFFNFSARSTSSGRQIRSGVGYYEATQDTDAFRFLYTTGNIFVGDYAVYGRV